MLKTKITLKCLSIGTLKIIDFPFVPNGKSMVLGVPIFKPIYLSCNFAKILGHLKIINLPFGTMENLLFLGVPILKHITVIK